MYNKVQTSIPTYPLVSGVVAFKIIFVCIFAEYLQFTSDQSFVDFQGGQTFNDASFELICVLQTKKFNQKNSFFEARKKTLLQP
jgi:hypothetical protein